MSRYTETHQDRVNLLIHIVAVPSFVLGLLGLPWALALGRWWLAIAAAAAVGIALAVQGAGHRREAVPPQPFEGPGDFVGRIMIEQLSTFPRFVVGGGWLRALRSRGSDPGSRG